MTRIKPNKASKGDALVPPPPPPADSVPADETTVNPDTSSNLSDTTAGSDTSTLGLTEAPGGSTENPKPATPTDSTAGANAGEAQSEVKSEATDDNPDFATDWKKLALGDDPEDIDGPVSPYQLEESPATPPASSPFAAGEFAGGVAVHEVPSSTAPEPGRDPVETGDTTPNSLDAVPEIPAGINPEITPDTALAPHETVPSPKPPTPAETDRAEREKRAQERAAAREAKRKERAQNKAAAKAKQAALKAEFAQIPDARRVKLTLTRISPLSATKIGFLVAVALALVQLVAAGLLWIVLDMLHVFSSMQGFLQALSATALVSLMDTLQLSRFLALVALNGVLQILIFTVLTWLATVIYNIIARMVGGLHVVLTDD
ncbi:DUF3566 domain-containing protein [Mobiluncus mulieris]|uniref:DUF3566 domain-containing protein n=1 Tax=Mobiluncus mulieris TaxID=2052 RepID=A0A7Y0UTN9_9ACTO|nr:DUF3566 domain-containing protein [Mobiluncus mulieris]NMX03517.1 hypothetical protein [Mobiluncus mulieris]NMX10707.1 hypothetical protein [Mobiluncus mulieris]